MTAEERVLWEKIASFKFDDDDSSFKFSHRLARENGWTIAYSNSVLEEYKKFLFLCCVSQGGVTPSDQVDQAWHLHLTYTKSYWIDLCRNTLGKEIHHNPTKGGKQEGKKFDNYYTATLLLYKEKFEHNAPKAIWPDNEKRFSDIHFRRVNLKRFWLIRRPSFSTKKLTLAVIVFLAYFFVQSRNDSKAAQLIILAIITIIILWYLFNDKGNGSGCSSGNGGSGGSIGSGCSGCSGCGTGGCSGCGGD